MYVLHLQLIKKVSSYSALGCLLLLILFKYYWSKEQSQLRAMLFNITILFQILICYLPFALDSVLNVSTRTINKQFKFENLIGFYF